MASPFSLEEAMLRIGQIDYANCVPIFSAFRQRHETEYVFVKGVPAQLNRMLQAGEIDLCPSSSIEYARHADEYLLLPGLSISSIGAVRSVMLFSYLPLTGLDGAVIGLSGESATSVILLRILLARYYHFTNQFVPVAGQSLVTDASMQAILLIGDAALRGVKENSTRYVYDLGELWYEATGLPFVFALWMVRRDAFIHEPSGVVDCARQLIMAKEMAKNSYSASAMAATADDFLTEDELIAYWEGISYDLTELHLQGVRQYYADAVAIGVLDHVPELGFIAEW